MLRAQVAWLKQQLFGPGRSETLDRAQLLLHLGALEKRAALGAGAQADYSGRLRLHGPSRVGTNREVLRSSPALSSGKDADALEHPDLASEPVRLGGRGNRAARTAGQVDESGPAAGVYVVVDETPIRCNDPDLRDGKTTQCPLWALTRPGGDAIFEWRLSRRHEEAQRLLGDYHGRIQSDGYEAYAAYARAHPGGEWLGCWAEHARRDSSRPQQSVPRPPRACCA